MKAIYAGTFDPLTNGHMDVISRASSCYEEVVVAVAGATGKNTLFSLEERMELVSQVCAGLPNITVETFDGLLVSYARERGINMLVRGLRAFSDFEYEFQMALINRRLAPDIETMFLMPSEQFSFISSSRVREVASLGGDASSLVPEIVFKALTEKLQK